MKRTITAIALVGALLMTNASLAGDDYYVGKISSKQLLSDFQDFNKQFLSYNASHQDIELIKNIETPIEIVALFGTWCHDSVREIPRLNKLLQSAKNPNITSSLIAVDYKKTADIKYNLKYTPTIIVYQQGNEIGRIIENPKKSIAQDIVAMLSN